MVESLHIEDLEKLLREWKSLFGNVEVFAMTDRGLASPIVELAEFNVSSEGDTEKRRALVLVNSESPCAADFPIEGDETN